MNADSAAAGDKANDWVTRNWSATAGKANKKIFKTFNMNPRFAVASQPMAKDLFGRRIDNTTRVERVRHSKSNTSSRLMPLPNCCQKAVEIALGCLFNNANKLIICPYLLQRYPLTSEFLGQFLSALFDRIKTTLPTEPLSNFVSGPSRNNEGQPVL